MGNDIDTFKYSSGYAIKISDSRDNILSVEPADIIKLCSPFKQLNWTLYHLWAIRKEESSFSMSSLTEQIESHGCVTFKYPELMGVFSNLHQTIDCLLVGHSDPPLPCRNQSFPEACTFGEIVMEICDSSFCLFFSKSVEIIQAIKAQYQDTDCI